MKLHERLQYEIESVHSVKGFKGNLNKLALENLLRGDPKQARQSLLMYLSANLFHKPKFPNLDAMTTLNLYCCRSGEKSLIRNVQLARNKLDKDLDITTYLRTVNKVKGIVQC